MKFNLCFVWGIAYLSIITGRAIAWVGKTTTGSFVPWWFPMQMLMVIGIPFVLGYFAGKDKE